MVDGRFGNNRKIALVADTGEDIGLGHLMRMTALGEMLFDKFEVILIAGSGSIESVLKQMFAKGEEDFLTLCKQADIVVLDGYRFTSEFQKAIKHTGAALVCIDDYQHTEYHADLVINHAPGVSKDQIVGQDYTRYLLGPEYALIRKPFCEPWRKKLKDVLSTVFICFGGADPYDLVTFYAELVDKNHEFVDRINVVVGPSYKGAILNKKANDKVIVHQSISALEMRNLIRQSDIAITSSSTILFETLSQNTPTMAGYYVENQKGIYAGFVNSGLIEPLDDLTKRSTTFKEALFNGSYWSDRMSQIERIFDGKIAERLVDNFIKL